MSTMTTRKCPKCKRKLGLQKTWHYTPDKTGYRGRRWCDGPRSVPLPEPLMFVNRKPLHLRYFTWLETVCGLRAGRIKGHYKDAAAQVSWNRVRIDLQQTTCEMCLVTIIQQAKERLHKRIKAKGGGPKLREIIQRAHGQRTIAKLSGLVGA